MKKLLTSITLIVLLSACSITQVKHGDTEITAKDYFFKRQSKISGTLNGAPFAVEINRIDSENLSELIKFGNTLATAAGGNVK